MVIMHRRVGRRFRDRIHAGIGQTPHSYLVRMLVGFTALLSIANTVQAQGSMPTFDIPAQSVSSALIAFGRQAGISVSVPSDLPPNLTSHVLVGTFTPMDALRKLLDGTPLTFEFVDAETVRISIRPRKTVTTTPAAPSRTISAPVDGQERLEEIVVTASKRPEAEREVPQSISVVEGAQIEAQHIRDYADLANAVPNLSYSNLGGPGLSNLEIRGVSSTIGQSTVSIYVDDAPITLRNLNFFVGEPEPQLFDLARVEVLRGPQGSLYGASAMGGTIKLVSNPVNLTDYEGEAFQELSGTKQGGLNYVTRGVLNIPVVNGTLGIRIGVETLEESGYVDHIDPSGVVDRKGINTNRVDVGKFALTYLATPDLTVAATAYVQRTEIDDTSHVDLATPNYFTSKLVPEPGQDSDSVSSLKVSYDLHWADLMSVSSYASRRFPRTTDGTAFDSGYLGYLLDSTGVVGVNGKPDGNIISTLPGPVDNVFDSAQFSEELRLASKSYRPGVGLPISWMVGLYYSDTRYHVTNASYVNNFNQTFQATYGVNPAQILGSTFPDNLVYQFNSLIDDQESAGFGEFSYYVTPRLRLSIGAREFFGFNSETDHQADYFTSTPYNHGVLRANAFTPKLSATYDVSDSVTTYATVAQGFRLGGINFPVPIAQCAGDLASFGLTAAPTKYQSDKLWNFEVGTKGTYFDRTTSFNAAVYDIEWSKITQDVLLPTCGFEFYDNLGHARSYGTEIELHQKLGRELTLGVAGDYDHDRFTEAVPGLGISSGDVVPGTPETSLDLSLAYEHHLSAPLEVFGQADWQYTGTSHGTFITTDQDYIRPSYSLLGLSVGIKSLRWQVSLFAKNLLDENKIIQRPFDNAVAQGYTPVPRIIGANGSVRF
jgi:iron complex outermembrane recepter protein